MRSKNCQLFQLKYILVLLFLKMTTLINKLSLRFDFMICAKYFLDYLQLVDQSTQLRTQWFLYLKLEFMFSSIFVFFSVFKVFVI